MTISGHAPLDLLVEGGIGEVDVLLIHFFLGKAQSLAKTLEVNDLTGAQKFDDIVDIRVIAEPKNVVIGHTGLLLGGEILGEIGNQIAFHGHGCGAIGEAGGRRGINAGGAIDEVGVKPGGFDLFAVQIAGQLMHDSTDHLQVSQFLCTFLADEK